MIWQYGTTPTAANAARRPPSVDADHRHDRRGLRRHGRRRRRRHGAPARRPAQGGAVAARSRSTCAGSSPLAAVLRRLRAGEPNCTIFSMPVPDGSFFGASPELLVARHGTRVTCHPLAGTVPRGDTARADADAQRDLAGLGQEPGRAPLRRRGHRRRPGALLRGAGRPDEPSVVAFRSVAHLGTRIEGRLRAPEPVRRARAARTPPPDPGRRRHAPRRGPGLHRRRTRRASGATGPDRWAGSAPTATGNG